MEKQLKILVLLILTLFVIDLQAQHRVRHPEKREKIDSAKVAYINERLNLNSNQSEKFMPLYKEYMDKKRNLRQEKASFKPQNDNLTSTDEQLKKDIEKQLELKQKEVDLEREYYQKFQKVITIRQIAELYKSERMFTRELIRDLHGGPRRGR